ncbi:uncharacterized protein LOC120289747 [Eucalyptus grandis]|uniref:uncharacterized protein LOC120289747 n=1 Tax=Eucalyptus grandis TaxID=71139 RepID=UPI00192F02D5|nr:uncharacterized protein LOC120289747 [Eucalyptus grandis]
MAQSGKIGGSAMDGEPRQVAGLIDLETGNWNEHLIKALFDDQKVQDILATPIGMPNEEDRLVWEKTKTKIYTVQSGYYANRDNPPNKKAQVGTPSYQAAIATSSHQPKPALRKFIWQSNSLPKVKHFLWNACHNAIPTMENLYRRKIVPDPLCPICKKEAETVEHTLLLCSWMTRIWKAAPAHQSVKNKVNQIRQLAQTIFKAEALHESYSIWNNTKKGEQHSETIPQRWKPPSPDSLKINIDASFLPSSDAETETRGYRGGRENRGAIACLCRDSRGRVVDGFAKLVAASTAEQAEAIALLETLIFLSNRTHLSLEVVSDCLPLMHSCNTLEDFSWEAKSAVGRAKTKLKLFRAISLAHCNRESNRPADWLAKACRNNTLPHNWLQNPPPALFDLLCADAFNVFSPHMT